jgi:tRNA pseudouridine(55) synthase
MHPPYAVIHKRRGETPLAAISRWKAANPAFTSLPASYAGRLDPMAEGKLLVLLGEECRKQKKYTKLDKEYEVEIALDLSTDTGDALGLPAYDAKESHPSRSKVLAAFAHVTGTHHVPYPAFSSKPVNGKPLFMHTLEGTLDTITIPEHDETIYRAKLIKIERWPSKELASHIEKALEIVPKSEETSKRLGADFRQDLIRVGWRTLLEHIPERDFTILRIRVVCASGTYMRTLATRIATELGTTGFAFSISRRKIGTYKKFGPFPLWTKTYR